MPTSPVDTFKSSLPQYAGITGARRAIGKFRNLTDADRAKMHALANKHFQVEAAATPTKSAPVKQLPAKPAAPAKKKESPAPALPAKKEAPKTVKASPAPKALPPAATAKPTKELKKAAPQQVKEDPAPKEKPSTPAAPKTSRKRIVGGTETIGTRLQEIRSTTETVREAVNSVCQIKGVDGTMDIRSSLDNAQKALTGILHELAQLAGQVGGIAVPAQPTRG